MSKSWFDSFPAVIEWTGKLVGDHKGAGQDVCSYVVCGMDYRHAVEVSRDLLTCAVTDDFIRETAEAVGVDLADVKDAIYGTERGRKGLLVSFSETLEKGVSDKGTVFEPVMGSDGNQIRGLKRYSGEGNPSDPKAPVKGSLYLEGILVQKTILEKGEEKKSNPGPVQKVKAFLCDSLNLPVAEYRILRISETSKVSDRYGKILYQG